MSFTANVVNKLSLGGIYTIYNLIITILIQKSVFVKNKNIIEDTIKFFNHDPHNHSFNLNTAKF